ncbi:hypothetical protein [Limnofasciculus baicalensis]|uniref:Uncharacterized protein n=1 Tax=Limnofasciculus baicalensis BBK-W-15 TaxID=2699891 RepID=A0AAE3KKQ7_9CYAN|nr:hypothetical protein [Limnofasciculus baicalensis]MCP2727785.1 hypothetical protein [Limnofasciculus baicalensis BBK-W-15]
MSDRSNYKLLSLGAAFLLFLLISLGFSIWFIKDFSIPLGGGGDYNIWEYLGFYFTRNLSFQPFPTLNLVNNQVFYPYGTNSVFQAWAIERDIFFATLYSLFWDGSWLQIYYLLTVIVTAVGSYSLLVWDYGIARSIGAGLIVSVGNFYVLNSYPNLGNVHHWTTLNFVADFLIVKRVTLRQDLPLRLILVRIGLLALSLGQPLGYVAALALLSLTVSLLFLTVILAYRYLREKLAIKELVAQRLRIYKKEIFTYTRQSLALLTFDVIVIYTYFPLALQIAREAKSFDFTKWPTGAWWANPLRAIIPYLPGLDPRQAFWQKIFQDSPEMLGSGSIGWFLLIIGAVGLWQTRKRIIIFIPLITILLLCSLYHPIHFPILKIFPWFSFYRVAGRSTAIYPVILCLFSLEINFSAIRRTKRQLLLSLMICLACTEVYTAYLPWINYQPFLFDKTFFTYMNYVKKQPGEAVLDWPFCVVGGNGMGLKELCPFYERNNSVFTLRRFHHKKVMGQYSGRLHPSQMEQYLQAGWDKLLFPDDTATRQKRCFKTDEWSFFEKFYQLNNFAGINLYVDLLPEDCVEEFYQRFGKPVVETLVAGAGQVKFIPKPPELRKQVNSALGVSLKFKSILDLAESNLLENESPHGIAVTGISTIEGSTPNNWRWALGSETSLVFELLTSQELNLLFSFDNPIEGQDVIVEVNGSTVKEITNIRKNEKIDQILKIPAVKGRNQIVFRYKYWNNKPVSFAPNDPRQMSISFTKFMIRPVNKE